MTGGTFAKLMGFGVGVTTVAGGSIAFAYSNKSEEKKNKVTENNNQPQSIAQLLTKNQLKMLGSENGDDTRWKAKWNQLKQDNNGDTIAQPWSFSNWKTIKTSNENTTPEEFKTECKTHGAKSVANEQDSIYVAVSKYCTKGINE